MSSATKPGVVVLVGCSRTKGPAPAPARTLYESARFHLASSWAQASGLPWFVLSGRHGLVAPDEVLAPYDFDLGAAGAAQVNAWAGRVAADLLGRVPGLRSAVLLAADPYADPVAACLTGAGVRSERPLAGLDPAACLRRLADLVG
jgi:hypothetical protein